VLHDVPKQARWASHQALPKLLPEGYHRPLVVALKSNVLIDLLQQVSLLILVEEA
jgi:hypothetical protein